MVDLSGTAQAEGETEGDVQIEAVAQGQQAAMRPAPQDRIAYPPVPQRALLAIGDAERRFISAAHRESFYRLRLDLVIICVLAAPAIIIHELAHLVMFRAVGYPAEAVRGVTFFEMSQTPGQLHLNKDALPEETVSSWRWQAVLAAPALVNIPIATAIFLLGVGGAIPGALSVVYTTLFLFGGLPDQVRDGPFRGVAAWVRDMVNSVSFRRTAETTDSGADDGEDGGR